MHKAEITELRGDITELKAAMSELVKTVNAMRDEFNENRGGWKMLALLGGAGATLGGVLTWVVDHLVGRHP